jgi:ubiquinone/menaquinone biosynthesis C-methylase UbiE
MQSKNNIVSFDSANAQRVDRQYATPALVEQRRRTLDAMALQPGQTALDIGCGPGYLTLEMARQVGASGRVIAVDTSQPMLDIARARCAGEDQVEFHPADAAALPCPDASIDVAAAVQVYLFVPNLEAVVRDLARVLRPGGRAVVIDTDWDSVVWHSGDRDRMERLLGVWMGRYANARVARVLPGTLRRAGLKVEHAGAIPLVELDPGENTYSGNQVTELARYVVAKGGIPAAEAAAWEEDLRALAKRGEYFFSLNRYVFVASKPRGSL